jgi:transcriptional regulator with XRE-family HTH domain
VANKKLSARTADRLDRVGEDLRKTRRVLGVSRVAIAQRLRMHPMNYAHIEQGKQNVTIDTLLRIADALGVELVVGFKRRRKRA